jgi:hypothetical protein
LIQKAKTKTTTVGRETKTTKRHATMGKCNERESEGKVHVLSTWIYPNRRLEGRERVLSQKMRIDGCFLPEAGILKKR